MTNDQVKAACGKYLAVLESGGSSPVRDPGARTREGRMNHLAWMCGEAPGFVEGEPSPERREKAMRWLGFVQGQLAAFDLMTVEEMKEDNR